MKERLDVILVARGLAQSRERAKELIRAGKVFMDGRQASKAGILLEEEAALEVRDNARKYVGRGGLKLEKALEKWEICLTGMVCMDVGASTGGFTDCMLQSGAAKVYAVDVGCGQLAEPLRADERVVCMERTNFRYLGKEAVGEEMDFLTVDVSFISLTKILIPARNLLKEGGQAVCLVKPQFEAGKGRVGKKGIVREPGIHREVIAGIMDYADVLGFAVLHLEYSPIRGAEGNTEYLLHLGRGEMSAGLPGSEQEAQERLAALPAAVRLSHGARWGREIGTVAEQARLAARTSQEGL